MAGSSAKAISLWSGNLPRLRVRSPATRAETAACEVAFTLPRGVVHQIRDAVLQVGLQLGRLILREVTVLDRSVDLRLRVAHDRVDDLAHVDALGFRDIGDRPAIAQIVHQLIGSDAQRLGGGAERVVLHAAEGTETEADTRSLEPAGKAGEGRWGGQRIVDQVGDVGLRD